jgi:hypothetical protein
VSWEVGPQLFMVLAVNDEGGAVFQKMVEGEAATTKLAAEYIDLGYEAKVFRCERVTFTVNRATTVTLK